MIDPIVPDKEGKQKPIKQGYIITSIIIVIRNHWCLYSSSYVRGLIDLDTETFTFVAIHLNKYHENEIELFLIDRELNNQPQARIRPLLEYKAKMALKYDAFCISSANVS